MTHIQVIIPFRDRGLDLRRAANLEIVQAWWYTHGFDPRIVSDGLEGDAPFNRHRAYNRAVAEHPGDVYVFTEADMLIHPDQIDLAVRLAQRKPCLVVPFTQYRYLSDYSTGRIRDYYHDYDSETIAEWWGFDTTAPASIFQTTPESVMDNGRSIGAVNIVSRETLEITGGFTEATHGNWYDDRIIEEGFAFLTGSHTNYVPGPAVHLYHIPGHPVGRDTSHLSAEDQAATKENKRLLRQMRWAIATDQHDWVRRLMKERR